jgi:hypothetical protein
MDPGFVWPDRRVAFYYTVVNLVRPMPDASDKRVSSLSMDE